MHYLLVHKSRKQNICLRQHYTHFRFILEFAVIFHGDVLTKAIIWKSCIAGRCSHLWKQIYLYFGALRKNPFFCRKLYYYYSFAELPWLAANEQGMAITSTWEVYWESNCLISIKKNKCCIKNKICFRRLLYAPQISLAILTLYRTVMNSLRCFNTGSQSSKCRQMRWTANPLLSSQFYWGRLSSHNVDVRN